MHPHAAHPSRVASERSIERTAVPIWRSRPDPRIGLLTRVCVLACTAVFASLAAASGPSMQATLLVDRCRGFTPEAPGTDALLCDSYIRGYLAGARTSGWLNVLSSDDSQETFAERAWRTRLGKSTRTPRPQSCLKDGTTMDALVAALIAYADTRASLQDVSARQLMEEMLRAAYPCSRVLP